MIANVVVAVLKRAETQRCVWMQQSTNKRLTVRVEGVLKAEVLLGVNDLFEYTLLVPTLKRCVTAKQFKHQDAKCPVVCIFVVALCQYDLTAKKIKIKIK